MWLITPFGFFSVVQKNSDIKAGTLTIRARLRSDLARLKQQYLPSLSHISESSDSDYRFRATATKTEVGQAMAQLVENIDYSNFKSEVHKKQGYYRAQLYGKLWSVLYQLQTDQQLQDIDAVTSAGAVLTDHEGRFLLRKPSGHFGGYHWTFAKTSQKPGEAPKETALRALKEKTGYQGVVILPLEGKFDTQHSDSQYFLCCGAVQQTTPNSQTASLYWATYHEARQLLAESTCAEGRDRDLAILEAAHYAQTLRMRTKSLPNVTADAPLLNALQAATQPNYLGSPSVVSQLIFDYFNHFLRHWKKESTDTEFTQAQSRFIAALTCDPNYQRMPWHSAGQLGKTLRDCLLPAAVQTKASQVAGNLHAVLELSLQQLNLQLKSLLQGFIDDPLADWEQHALVQLNGLHGFLQAVLMGTQMLEYQGKHLSHYVWQPVRPD